MNEALRAVELVVECGFDHRDALEAVIEADPEKTAKKMAKEKAPDDPEKQKELEAKYKKELEAKKPFPGAAPPFKKKKEKKEY